MNKIISFAIAVLALSQSAFADDHGDTFGDATVIPQGQLTIDGRLDTTSDDDWFCFTVSQRSQVLMYTVNPTPAALTTDTFAYLYDAGGNYLNISDANDGAGTNFSINQILNAGTYYIRVLNYNRNVVGDYRLYIHTSDNAVNFPGSEIYGTINLLGENTFYRFSLTKRQRVLLYTVNPTPSALTTDTFAYLYDAGGNYLNISDANDGAGKNFSINQILDAGTYYVRVLNYNQNEIGGYSLRMTNQETATPINPGSHSASLDLAGDNDFYKFTLPSSDVVTMESTGSTDTFAYLYDAGGNYLNISDANDGAGANFHISKTLDAGTYYLRVLNYNQNETGAYNLLLSFGTGGGGSATANAYYADANNYYIYFASQGDTNTGLAYWFYFRAYGDRAYYQAYGDNGTAQLKYYQGLGYFYFTFYKYSSANLGAYYLYLYFAYAYYDYFNAIGDYSGARNNYNNYYALALSVL